MQTTATVQRGISPVLGSKPEALAAARRMVELMEFVLPNLSSGRELSLRQASLLSAELKLIRCSVDALTANPANLNAAAHVRKALAILDSMVSARLWVLEPAIAEEWQACRATAWNGRAPCRDVRGRLGRDQLRALQDLLELARTFR